MSDASRRPGELGTRFVELFVLAPLGAGARLASDLPQAVSRARQELSNARFIGRMVVEQGASRLAQRPPSSPTSDEPATTVTDTDVTDTDMTDTDMTDTDMTDTDMTDTDMTDTDVTDDEPTTDSTNPAAGSRLVDADELAIPDYDHLPALDIVGQLDRLTSGERAEVERYERAHRGRRTVLGKLAQLAESA